MYTLLPVISLILIKSTGHFSFFNYKIDNKIFVTFVFIMPVRFATHCTMFNADLRKNKTCLRNTGGKVDKLVSNFFTERDVTSLINKTDEKQTFDKPSERRMVVIRKLTV